jgi:hypothetical protein
VALNKQLISIPFTSGMNYATDAHLLPVARLSVLQNARFGSSNSIKKTGGYSSVNVTERYGTAYSTTSNLAARGPELIIEDKQGFFHVADPTGTKQTGSLFYDVGPRASVTVRDVKADSIVPSGFQTVTMASNGTLNVLLVNDGAQHAVRLETVDGGLVTMHYGLTLTVPRVVWDASVSVFRIFYVELGVGLRMRTINPSSPNTLTAAVTVRAVAVVGDCLDAVYDPGTQDCWVVYLSAGGTFEVTQYSGTLGAAVGSVSSGATGLTITRGLSICVVNTTVFVLAGHTTGQNLFRTTTALGVIGASTVVVVSNFTIKSSLCADLVAGQAVGAYEDGPALTANSNRFVRVFYATTAGAIASAGSLANRGLASKPVVVDEAPFTTPYLLTVYYSTTQPTLFCELAATGRFPLAARALTGEAGGYGNAPFLTNRVTDGFSAGDGEVRFPAFRRSSEALFAATSVGDLAMLSIKLTGQSAAPLQALEHGNDLFWAGARPAVWDGITFQEASFHIRPNDETTVLTDFAAGAMSAGTYSYCATYEFQDSSGRRWQSAPSVPSTITLAAGRQAQVQVQGDSFTQRDSPSPSDNQHTIYIWRTEADGSIFYQVGRAANDVTGALVTFNDNVADTALIGREPLYTNGGELPKDPYPAHRLLARHQERLFMAGCEDPYRIVYTDVLEPGLGPAFRPGQELSVPQSMGQITALASMDDKLIVFCEQGIWYFYGEGPNVLGEFNNYSFAQEVVSGMGVPLNSPGSVLVTPDGCWFRSQFGMRLLGRNLQLARNAEGQYAGAEVDVVANAAVSSAVLLPEEHAVRFYVGAQAVQYDYQYGQWSYLTGQNAASTITHQGRSYILNSSGGLYLVGGLTQAGATFLMGFSTAWIQLSDIAGFMRAYEIQLLGTAVNGLNAGYTISYQRDYADGGGGTATYVNDPSGGPQMARHRLAIQKCASIQFTVVEDVVGGVADGWTFSGMSLLVGLKPGIYKRQNARTY